MDRVSPSGGRGPLSRYFSLDLGVRNCHSFHYWTTDSRIWPFCGQVYQMSRVGVVVWGTRLDQYQQSAIELSGTPPITYYIPSVFFYQQHHPRSSSLGNTNFCCVTSCFHRLICHPFCCHLRDPSPDWQFTPATIVGDVHLALKSDDILRALGIGFEERPARGILPRTMWYCSC